MKFCKDCRHADTRNPYVFVCCHPDNPGAVDLVTGNRVGGTAFCSVVRQDIRRCAPSAQWFDPATLDAKLEMLEENTRTIYLVSGGGNAPKAYAFRSAAEKNMIAEQIITPVEYWDKQ